MSLWDKLKGMLRMDNRTVTFVDNEGNKTLPRLKTYIFEYRYYKDIMQYTIEAYSKSEAKGLLKDHLAKIGMSTARNWWFVRQY